MGHLRKKAFCKTVKKEEQEREERKGRGKGKERFFCPTGHGKKKDGYEKEKEIIIYHRVPYIAYGLLFQS